MVAHIRGPLRLYLFLRAVNWISVLFQLIMFWLLAEDLSLAGLISNMLIMLLPLGSILFLRLTEEIIINQSSTTTWN